MGTVVPAGVGLGQLTISTLFLVCEYLFFTILVFEGEKDNDTLTIASHAHVLSNF